MQKKIGLFLMSQKVGEPWGRLGLIRISTGLTLKLLAHSCVVAVYTKMFRWGSEEWRSEVGDESLWQSITKQKFFMRPGSEKLSKFKAHIWAPRNTTKVEGSKNTQLNIAKVDYNICFINSAWKWLTTAAEVDRAQVLPDLDFVPKNMFSPNYIASALQILL
jgi:hypothetical protein